MKSNQIPAANNALKRLDEISAARSVCTFSIMVGMPQASKALTYFLSQDACNRVADFIDHELRLCALGYKDTLAGFGVDTSDVSIAPSRLVEP